MERVKLLQVLVSDLGPIISVLIQLSWRKLICFRDAGEEGGKSGRTDGCDR